MYTHVITGDYRQILTAKAGFLFECTPSIVGGPGCQQHISRSPGRGGKSREGVGKRLKASRGGSARTAVGRIVPQAGAGGWSTPVVTAAAEGYYCKSIMIEVVGGGGGGGGFQPKFRADLGAVITRLASEFQQKILSVDDLTDDAVQSWHIIRWFKEWIDRTVHAIIDCIPSKFESFPSNLDNKVMCWARLLLDVAQFSCPAINTLVIIRINYLIKW